MTDPNIPDFSEYDDPKVVAAEVAMRAQGVATTETAQADYFGFEEVLIVKLPDGISWIQHQVLNEGARRKYLNSANRDVKFQKTTGDAIMRMQPGDEKHSLLSQAIVGWNLARGGKPVAFNKAELDKFLEKSSPKIIDLIHKEVVKANPWLLAEMSPADIKTEIERLQEMLAVAEEREAGKAAS